MHLLAREMTRNHALGEGSGDCNGDCNHLGTWMMPNRSNRFHQIHHWTEFYTQKMRGEWIIIIYQMVNWSIFIHMYHNFLVNFSSSNGKSLPVDLAIFRRQARAGDDDHHGPFLAGQFAAPAWGMLRLEVAVARRSVGTGMCWTRLAERMA